MAKASMQLSALLYLTAFVTVGWSTAIPGRDQMSPLNGSPSKILVSKADKPSSVASSDAKDNLGGVNIVDAPDPATPLLVGSGLIALSLLRRKLRRKMPDE